MTTPTPHHLHNALQHQAHQPLPPEQFRNHQYHLHLNPIHNGGSIGGEHSNVHYGGGGPAPPGAPFSSSITSGSPSIGGGSGPMAFPGPAAGVWHGGPPPMHVSGGPLYQNGGLRSNAGWAPDTFDIGGLRYPMRSIPLLYSPYDVFQSGQHPPQWQSFQRRHTQYS